MVYSRFLGFHGKYRPTSTLLILVLVPIHSELLKRIAMQVRTEDCTPQGSWTGSIRYCTSQALVSKKVWLTTLASMLWTCTAARDHKPREHQNFKQNSFATDIFVAHRAPRSACRRSFNANAQGGHYVLSQNMAHLMRWRLKWRWEIH